MTAVSATLWFLLAASAPPASAPASAPEQPIVLRIDSDKVITREFLGFGVELDPMALNANNRRRGVTDADWKLLTGRLAEMRLPIVRMMTQLRWFARDGPDRFDYDNPQAKSVLAYLDFCQANNVDVILTDWAWVGQCRWLKGHDDPAYARGIATYLKFLLEQKNYSCIKFLVVGNEPDNEIKDVEKYGRMYHNVDAALKAAGLREKVRLMGPDIAGQWDWFDKAAARIAGVVDAYDFHRYATVEEVRDDGQKMLHRNLTRFRPVVNRVDPKGADKPILVTEMGMAGGSTNDHRLIDTFDYALHMGDYAIGVLNSGAAAGIAWCAFDVYYFEGDQFMTWGMWKYKDKDWQPKPWHAVWQLVTQHVPRNCTVLAVEGVGADIHAGAVNWMAAGVGITSVLLSNRGERSATISLQGAKWPYLKTTTVTAGADGKAVVAELGPLGAQGQEIRLLLPGRSFTVVQFHEHWNVP